MPHRSVPRKLSRRARRLWPGIAFLQFLSCLYLGQRYWHLQQEITLQQQQIQCLESRSLDTRADLSRCRLP